MSLSLGERDGINKTVWTFCSRARNGLAPMHLCAQEDRVNVAAILAARGAELDAETMAGYTPLHVACHFGSLSMVRFLLLEANGRYSHYTHCILLMVKKY